MAVSTLSRRNFQKISKGAVNVADTIGVGIGPAITLLCYKTKDVLPDKE